jgi:hypothetical protein
MKKFTFILVFFVVFSIVYAQSGQTYTEEFDSIFSNISRDDATTGILYDRVAQFACLYNFNAVDSVAF